MTFPMINHEQMYRHAAAACTMPLLAKTALETYYCFSDEAELAYFGAAVVRVFDEGSGRLVQNMTVDVMIGVN